MRPLLHPGLHLALIVLPALLAACDLFGDDPSPLRNKIILSTSFGEEEQQIYAMNPDGSELKRLSRGRSMARSPSVSPDGMKIVYVAPGRTTAGNPLYVMEADGSSPRSLATLIGYEHPSFGSVIFGENPEWSPGGGRIVFDYCMSCELGSVNLEILMVDLEAKQYVRLTDNMAGDWRPIWSPDGKQLLFLSDRDFIHTENRGGSELYLMDADGTNQRRLTFTGGKVRAKAAWAPAGDRIAFIENGETIVVMNLEGTRLQEITPARPTDSVHMPLQWSPDGTKLLFGMADLENAPQEEKLIVLDLKTRATEVILRSQGWIWADWTGD